MDFNTLLVAFALLTLYFHFLTSRDTHFFHFLYQLIAYELALMKGINPDVPRNLAKAVTTD